ncbi:MAG: hypothetical protein LGB70_02945 [Sulfurovum sp.]|nr:hypothetical protein [Sulfurovum sp.]
MSQQYDVVFSLKVTQYFSMALSGKGKYYIYNEKDTPFVSAEVGQFIAIGLEEPECVCMGGIGYAFGNNEVELGLIHLGIYEKTVNLLLSYRYLF